jgi:hypothetical protein
MAAHQDPESGFKSLPNTAPTQAGTQERAEVLHSLEVGDDDAAGVCDYVAHEQDAAVSQYLVGGAGRTGDWKRWPVVRQFATSRSWELSFSACVCGKEALSRLAPSRAFDPFVHS